MIGAYIFCPKTTDPTTKLRQLAYAVSSSPSAAAAATGLALSVDQFKEGAAAGGAYQKERLALHICASTKKITCRSYIVTDHKAAAKPCDWKLQKFVTKWQRLGCSAEVDAVIAVRPSSSKGGGAEASGTFALGVLEAMAPTIAQFSTAIIVSSDAAVGDSPRAELPSGSTDAALLFDVFLRPASIPFQLTVPPTVAILHHVP